MEITVIKQTIALIKDDTLIRGSERIYSANFVFDATWDGFMKTAHFQAGSVTSSVELVNDTCSIPPECLKEAGVMLKVYVSGIKGTEEQSTPWCNVSRVLYDTIIDVPSGSHSCSCSGTTYTGEVGRLCDDFADALNDGYTEDELKDKTLSEIIGNMDGLDNTATDAEVSAMLNEVWGTK